MHPSENLILGGSAENIKAFETKTKTEKNLELEGDTPRWLKCIEITETGVILVYSNRLIESLGLDKTTLELTAGEKFIIEEKEESTSLS